MAKTTFIDGVTTVTAAWLNEHFGTDGHVHDGQDEDGHAPKVDLQDHVTVGDNAAFVVNADTPSNHEIEYKGLGGAVTKLIAFSFQAPGDVIAESSIRCNDLKARTGETIYLRASGGFFGTLVAGRIDAPNTPGLRAGHWVIENDGTDYVVANGEPNNGIGIASITDNRATIANGSAGLRTIDIALINEPTGGTAGNRFKTVVQVTPCGFGMPDKLFARATYQPVSGVRITIVDDAGNARDTDFNLSVYHV